MKKLAKSYTIHVTYLDIEAGRQSVSSPTRCPIALALRARFGPHANIRSGYEGAFVADRYYDYPVKAKDFQSALFNDRNAEVPSFKFVMKYKRGA